MADFDSSLRIRTENAGDAIVKIADATLPSQQLKVEADGSINVNAAFSPGTEVIITDGTDDLAINGDGSLNAVVTATNLDIRDLAFATDKVDVSGSSVTVTATNLDIRDLAFATDKVDVSGSSVTVTATDLDIRDLNSATDSVTVLATNLDIRDLAFATDKVDVSGSSVTVSATDLDIRDLNSASDSVTVLATNLDIRDLTHATDSVKVGDGTDFLAVNADGSINVRVSKLTPSTSVNAYNTATVAAGGTSNHTYTAVGNFYLEQIEASGSDRMKIEVQVNGTTRFVQFNSTATPNMSIVLEQPILATAGQTVVIIRTNRSNQSQDVYSTITGYEA